MMIDFATNNVKSNTNKSHLIRILSSRRLVVQKTFLVTKIEKFNE